MGRKFFKIIKFQKMANGLYRVKLSSVYNKNCSEKKYLDVDDKTLEGLKFLAREDRRQETNDYRHLSIFSYDELGKDIIVDSAEDKYIEQIESMQLREALMQLDPLVRRRFIRRYLFGMSCEEISRLDGVSRAAVSLSIKNAKIFLRSYLENK